MTGGAYERTGTSRHLINKLNAYHLNNRAVGVRFLDLGGSRFTCDSPELFLDDT